MTSSCVSCQHIITPYGYSEECERIYPILNHWGLESFTIYALFKKKRRYFTGYHLAQTYMNNDFCWATNMPINSLTPGRCDSNFIYVISKQFAMSYTQNRFWNIALSQPNANGPYWWKKSTFFQVMAWFRQETTAIANALLLLTWFNFNSSMDK